MKKNRKRVEAYRFNGYPHFHAGSIHSVTIADLESRIKGFQAKLTDPNDKKWTARWLSKFKQELARSETGWL